MSLRHSLNFFWTGHVHRYWWAEKERCDPDYEFLFADMDRELALNALRKHRAALRAIGFTPEEQAKYDARVEAINFRLDGMIRRNRKAAR